jgi:predicted metal-dependent peptidase
MVNIAESLAKASKTLILKEPFYGLFLVGLNKTFRTDIPTAGVSKNGIGVQLTVNPEFFSNLPTLHQIGLLKHELLHISFGHLIMRDIYSNHKLFNIAADLEVNQYIEETYLPEGGITIDSFPELKLPKKAGTRKYYELLDSACEGECPCESLETLLNQMDGESQYCHKTWKEFDELTEADKKLVQKQIEHQLKETAEQTEKRCGNVPGELADLISRLTHIEPPKFDWKGYLKRFVGNSSICYTKKLRRKFNKRYVEMAGLKVKFKNNILVGVDTSGSVSTSELKEFMNELNHMHKTGHQITVAQCDYDLQDVSIFNPKKDWNIKGRGGTSFQPVIDLYNQKKGFYTALIYLTDGEAYTPEDCPNNTLWVHSTKCSINEELPGLKIQLN